MAKVLRLLTVFATTAIWHNLCFATRVIHIASNNDTNTDVLAIKDSKAYVGGTNYFLEINLNENANETVNRVVFTATEQIRSTCMLYSERRFCDNTVRILEFTSRGSLLVCGTNARTPKCYDYYQENATFTEMNLGVGSWMPESPTAELISLFTNSGELYVVSERSSSASGVRLFRKNGKSKNLKTELGWLGGTDSEFIGMYDVLDKNYIYIFFNEKSSLFVRDKFDANNQKKDYYSMVARVCKNDMGGSWHKETWVTFSKARLACPWTKVAKENTASLYYDELISVYSYGESIFGLFKANRNWDLEMYALAEFDTNVIDMAMDGKFFPDNRTRYFQPTDPNTEKLFQSSTGNAPPFEAGQCPTTRNYSLSNEFERFLIDKTLVKINILPKQETLFFVGRSKMDFKYIFVQKLIWCDAVFLLRGDGYFKKLILLPDRSVIELYEQITFSDPDHILAASLVEDKNIILATTATKVISISVANCSVYTNCSSCNSDPHCSWRTNAVDLEVTCQDAVSSQKRSCSSPLKSPQNLLTKLTESHLAISWTGAKLPMGLYTIIILRIQNTRNIVKRRKTDEEMLNINRSILREGCIYEVTAAAMNETTLSEVVKSTFNISLQNPHLTLLEEDNAFVLSWSAVPGASRYVVEVADHRNEILQEVFVLANSSDLSFYLRKTESSEIITVTLRALSEDNIKSVSSVEVMPRQKLSGTISYNITELVRDAPERCRGITLALAIIVVLFACCLFVILHNLCTIKPRVDELKSDLNKCYYRRRCLFIWSKRHESVHIKCDDAVMSSTNA